MRPTCYSARAFDADQHGNLLISCDLEGSQFRADQQPWALGKEIVALMWRRKRPWRRRKSRTVLVSDHLAALFRASADQSNIHLPWPLAESHAPRTEMIHGAFRYDVLEDQVQVHCGKPCQSVDAVTLQFDAVRKEVRSALICHETNAECRKCLSNGSVAFDQLWLRVGLGVGPVAVNQRVAGSSPAGGAK